MLRSSPLSYPPISARPISARPQGLLQALPETRSQAPLPDRPDRRGERSSERASHPNGHISPMFPVLADIRVIFEHDPAARNWLEVLCCYPGLHALLGHRLAHWLYRHRLPVLPRIISHMMRILTGIEIHPGAQIGKGVFIDHGMGVVIGETAIVGDYTLIYQGVTLGGTGKETGKRHPTVGCHAIIGAGAKVLGNIQIGDYSRVGAGSVVLRDVPSHCTAVGVPSRNLCRSNVETAPLEHGSVPDAQAKALAVLLQRLEALEREVQALKAPGSTATQPVGEAGAACQ